MKGDMNMDDIFKPKEKESCSLIEAIEYIAFSWEPGQTLNKRQLKIRKFSYTYNEVEEAKNLLSILIQTGLLHFQKTTKEDITLKESVHIDDNGIVHKSNIKAIDYYDVFFDFEELKKKVKELKENLSTEEGRNIIIKLLKGNYTTTELTTEKELKQEPEYSTPYLEIMEEVVERLKITNENQPVIKIIESEIEKVAKEKKLSLGIQKINAMASFLRLPESQKGGLKKYKRA